MEHSSTTKSEHTFKICSPNRQAYQTSCFDHKDNPPIGRMVFRTIPTKHQEYFTTQPDPTLGIWILNIYMVFMGLFMFFLILFIIFWKEILHEGKVSEFTTQKQEESMGPWPGHVDSL